MPGHQMHIGRGIRVARPRDERITHCQLNLFIELRPGEMLLQAVSQALEFRGHFEYSHPSRCSRVHI